MECFTHRLQNNWTASKRGNILFFHRNEVIFFEWELPKNYVEETQLVYFIDLLLHVFCDFFLVMCWQFHVSCTVYIGNKKERKEIGCMMLFCYFVCIFFCVVGAAGLRLHWFVYTHNIFAIWAPAFWIFWMDLTHIGLFIFLVFKDHWFCAVFRSGMWSFAWWITNRKISTYPPKQTNKQNKKERKNNNKKQPQRSGRHTGCYLLDRFSKHTHTNKNPQHNESMRVCLCVCVCKQACACVLQCVCVCSRWGRKLGVC